MNSCTTTLSEPVQVLDSITAERRAEINRTAGRAWLSKKRITISIVVFSALVLFNLMVVRTRPADPFTPQNIETVLATGLVILGLAVRSWAAGTLHKGRELTDHGPYALTRNPLYVGSFLMMFGFCLLMHDWLALAFVAGPMAVMYWLQVAFEERTLEKLFGEKWQKYAQKTGRLFPRRITKDIFTGCSLQQWRKNREHQAVLATVFGLILLKIIHDHWQH